MAKVASAAEWLKTINFYIRSAYLETELYGSWFWLSNELLHPTYPLYALDSLFHPPETEEQDAKE